MSATTEQKQREREYMLRYGFICRQVGGWGIFASVVWFGFNMAVVRDGNLLTLNALVFAVFTAILSIGLSLQEIWSDGWPFTQNFSGIYRFISALTVLVVVVSNWNGLIGFLRGMFHH